MRKAYPSDITREQFAMIEPELAGARKRTHPRTYELYDIFCAILYLVKEGCTWRAICLMAFPAQVKPVLPTPRFSQMGECPLPL